MRKIVLFTALSCLLIFVNVSAQTSHTGIRSITSMEVTADMAPGINLYNTLDTYCWYWPQGLESETCWGNPYTTLEMVTAFAERGFKTLRLPVTWYNHMGAGPEYQIDTAWMDRVEEVANYAFDNNMYVIINMHHEDYDESKEHTWLCPTYEKQEAVTDQLEKVWTHIATRFKDYGDYLIFETMNEPREVGSADEWTGGSAEHREVVNAFNLAAVNAIRGTGGNNESRFIMVPQVVANPTAAMQDLIIPNGDTNIIVSIHNYNPYSFCLEDPGVSTWGTTSDKTNLRNEIMSYYDHWTSKGQAVVLGEWGVADKKNPAERVTYYDVFAQACRDAKVTPVSWIYAFNRNTLTWDFPMLEDAIMFAYDTNTVVVEDITLNIEARDTLYVGDTLQLKATIAPENATSQGIIWTSSKKDVASISSEGLITAKAKGRATVTATTIGKAVKSYMVVLDTTTVTDIKQSSNSLIKVYPNPVNDKLNITLSGMPTQVSMFTLDGRQLLFLETEEPLLQIDMREFKTGTYLLKIVSAGNTITKKVLVV